MLSDSSHLTDEEYYAAGHDYIGIKLKRETAEDLEAKGWRVWLMKLMPFRFEDEFSDDHIKYWELCWSVLLRIRMQQKLYRSGVWPINPADEEQWLRERHCWIEHKEMVRLLILGRGMAKSSSIEAGAVMRACLLGAGYCLYVCESQDQAEEHLGNIRELIEHDESLILEYYPHMEVDPNAKVNGKKTKDRTDLFITKGGFIGRAKGLNANLRGLRIGGFRPDQITLDDIDGVNDSYAVSLKKFKQITATVIGTQARRWATIDFGQNLIGENSVMNMIHTGRQDALAERTTIGVSNTFVQFREGIEYKTWMDEEDGRIKHTILPAAIPTWAGVNIAQAQKFLNDSGLATFLAEYMNSFDHLKTDKVYHEFNEARHIITWSQFQAKFGYRYLPGNWRAKVAGDLGYSLKSDSTWLFAACSPQNTVLPSRYFAYRSKTYKQTSIDDQAVDLWEDLFPDPESGKPHFEATQKFSNYPELFRLLDQKPRCSSLLRRFEYDARTNKYSEPKIDLATVAPEELALFHVRQAQKSFKSQIGAWIISHEKTGEQKTLAQKYGLPVSKTKNFGKRDGIQEANHLLRGDYSVPHPFHDDEIDPITGLYRLGSPFMFIIVDDEQVKAPCDDRGFKEFREQIAMQIWTPEKLGEAGLAQMVPFKAKQADHCDAFRMWAAEYATPSSTKKTIREQYLDEIPDDLRYKPVEERAAEAKIITPEMQMDMEFAQEQAREKMSKNLGLIEEDDEFGEDYGFEDDDDL